MNFFIHANFKDSAFAFIHACMLLCIPFSLTGSSSALASASPRLLEPLPGVEISKPPVIRSRRAEVVWPSLHKAGDSTANAYEIGHRLLLNLFEDVNLTCKIKKINRRNNRSVSLILNIEGLPSHYNATFSIKNKILAGAVFLPERQYRIRYSGLGFHIIEEIDPFKFPGEANPAEIDPFKFPGEANQAEVNPLKFPSEANPAEIDPLKFPSEANPIVRP